MWLGDKADDPRRILMLFDASISIRHPRVTGVPPHDGLNGPDGRRAKERA